MELTSTDVVIPAHNEEASIGRCLESILADAGPSEFRVIVVCNGCTDRSLQVVQKFANAYPKHVVVALNEPLPSKIAALNLGISSTQGRPVIFLDADVLLCTDAARKLRDALCDPDVHAASTAISLNLDGCSILSRSYHRFWSELPSIKRGLAGRGVYALDGDALDRIGAQFPDVVADDRYVDLLFGDDERVIVESTSTVRASRGVSELVARKARVFAGNAEVETILPTAERAAAGWRRVVAENPLRLLDLPSYLSVNLLAKAKAKYLGRRGAISWGRDDSSRSVEI